MKPEETVDFHIRWVWAKISRMYNHEAAKSGGTMSIGYALLSIDKENGTPSTSLGPMMGMEATSLSRTLKKMEDLELITREKDEHDKRKVILKLTKAGLEMRNRSRDVVLDFNNKIRDHIDPKKLDCFFEVMSEINGLIEDNKCIKNQHEKIN